MLFPQIIAHRGLSCLKRNSLSAISAALNSNFSIETDIRSYNGKLYISHEPITSNFELVDFESFLEIALQHRDKKFFLNIKEDGLLPYFYPYRREITQLDIIFFDMSVPELNRYIKEFPPFNIATRVSDIEKVPVLVELCDWIWIDCFKQELSTEELLDIYEKYPRNLVFVSPELHGRSPEYFWEVIFNLMIDKSKVYICTDFPKEILKKGESA